MPDALGSAADLVHRVQHRLRALILSAIMLTVLEVRAFYL